MLGDAVQKRNHLKAIEVALLGNKRAPYLGLRYQSVVEHAPDLAYRRESLVSDIEREIRELFFNLVCLVYCVTRIEMPCIGPLKIVCRFVQKV